MAAYEGIQTNWTFLAGEDLSGSQFKFVKLNTDGEVVIATAGDPAVGVLQNDPREGEAATVTVLGISKVQADAELTAGVLVGSSADGQAAADAASSYVLGQTLTAAGAAGEICSVLLLHSGVVTEGA